MGLSRKLGGGTVSARSAEPPDGVDYQWSTQAYTMREILTRFQLPCVVQCSGDAGTVLWADFRFDMRQPLLLHAARTVRKIHARSLQTDSVTKQMEEFGPPLAIPEDYDGWFFPVNKQDPTSLPKHLRIESVAASEARRFLVTTALPAFTPRQGSDNDPKMEPHEVTNGEVLTKVGVVKGDVGGSGSASPSLLAQHTRQSLQCVDENQQVVVIPFSHRALMYDVAENYGRQSGCQASVTSGRPVASCVTSRKGSTDVPNVPGVVSTCTLVTAGNAYLPRVFRHVLGDPPALTDVFTGLLRCYSVFTEETVMAATMSRTNLASMSEYPSCLELGTDSTARFKIALNATDLKKTNQYNAALTTCEEQAPSYVRAMKTSFTVQPVVPDLDYGDLAMHEKLKPSAAQEYEHVQGVSFDSDPGTSTDKAVDDCGDYVNVATLSIGTADTLALNDCDESDTTDDVDSVSGVDTSMSDYTDMHSCDVASMSDTAEVEASSEFDISWGQLRRARSFEGSLSAENSGSESSTIHSDSEDSDHDYMSIKSDDLSNISQLSSTSQNTVVLRQSRMPHSGTESQEQSDKEESTVSEVSSFGEVDIDGVFRVPPGVTVLETELSEASVNDNGRRFLWGGGSSPSSVARQRNLSSEEIRRQEIQVKTYDGVKRLEAILQGADVADFVSGASKQNSAVNGGGFVSVTNMSENYTSTQSYAENSTAQPYLEIPKRSRMQSHPLFQPKQSYGCSTFSTFQPRSTSSSTSRIQETHKNEISRHCESDPNFIREKDARNSESQPDLDFVKSLGEKLLAVSKRSSAPKYQRLEAEGDLTPSTLPGDDHKHVRKWLKQNTFLPDTAVSKQSVVSGITTTGNPQIVRDTSTIGEGGTEDGQPRYNAVFDEFDLLEEEIV